MRIAVCDDDIYMLRVLGEYFKRLGDSRLECSVDYFGSGSDLIQAITREKYDLLLLDVELNGANGLEIVKTIGRRREGLFVVFVSKYREYVLDALGSKACYYLLKPVMFEEFRQVIRNVFDRYMKYHRKFCVAFNHEVVSLELGDIYYFESYQRKTFVYTATDRYRISDRLDMIEKRLPSDTFLRIHQGYIVNMNYVRNIVRQDLFLSDGRRLEISFRKKKDVYERFKRYLMEN